MTHTATTINTIEGHELTHPSRFLPGHVLTANEANALSQYLGESVTHNIRKSLKTLNTEYGSAALVPPEKFAAVEADFRSRCAKYEFGIRQERQPTKTPLEQEAYSIALEAVMKGIPALNAHLLSQGKIALEISKLTKADKDELVATWRKKQSKKHPGKTLGQIADENAVTAIRVREAAAAAASEED